LPEKMMLTSRGVAESRIVLRRIVIEISRAIVMIFTSLLITGILG